MKEYEVYIPLDYNDGSPIESEKLVKVRDRLLEQNELAPFSPGFTGSQRGRRC